MDQDSDLLPWIFGGLMIATLAVALAVGSANRSTPRNLPTLSRTATQALPAIAPTPAPAPAPTPSVQAAQIQIVTPPSEPSGQIWECTINGQKTFSDHPCGDESSLRELGEINRMDSTPILPRARSYEPESRYQPEYSYPNEQENPAPSEQQLADNWYPVYVGIPVHERGRPDHAHRPPSHHRGPPPRIN